MRQEARACLTRAKDLLAKNELAASGMPASNCAWLSSVLPTRRLGLIGNRGAARGQCAPRIFELESVRTSPKPDYGGEDANAKRNIRGRNK
jgi:hypothetical protein